LAVEQKAKLVLKKHVTDGKKFARPLEKQIADKYIERKKEYQVIITEGKKIGRVNGMAVIGGEESFSGIILPIEAQVTAGGKKADVVATGKLGEIAKEAIKNVSAIIMKYFGEDIKETYDIYVHSSGNITFFSVVQPSSIDVVAFSNVSVVAGDKVEIIGKGEEYKNEMEIIAHRIRLMQ